MTVSKPLLWVPRLAAPRRVSQPHRRLVSTQADATGPPKNGLFTVPAAGIHPPADPEPPAPRVRQWAGEHGVAFPNALKALGVKAPRPLALRVTHSRQHVFHPWHLRFLGQHAYCELTLRRYATKKEREALWWFVVLHTDDGLKKSAFVRSAMRKTVERAFREALARRGFDKTGKRLRGPEEEVGGAKRSGIGELRGSVKIEGVIGGLLTTPSVVVGRFCDEVVEKLETTLGVSEAQLETETAEKIRRLTIKEGREKAGKRAKDVGGIPRASTRETRGVRGGRRT